MAQAKTQNPMRAPRIHKVVVNIGVGEGGDKLVKAERVMQMITNAKTARTVSKVANRDFNIREGMPIGVRVTLRGAAAEEFLARAIGVKENRLNEFNFDDHGNLNFGITDYTEFPGMRYDPEIGIFGMDIAVVIERAGARIKRRRVLTRSVPKPQRVTRAESKEFIASKFNAQVV